MRHLFLASAIVALSGAAAGSSQQPVYRTLNDTFKPTPYASIDQWKRRAAYLREHILASAGLLPMPEKTPLKPAVFGEVKRSDYTVSKVYFESLPGFFVTGNLYRPIGDGPFPAIVSPHGHWTYGRLESTPLASVPGRAINLARQGFVVFTYDMIGYNDSRQLTHTFGGQREFMWGLSLAGLQLWNSIRALDFLESLPYVKKDALGATGASGGGTQTFLLAAVDDRVKAAAPVNMISLHMQGGCLCENEPNLRLDTNNVEIASTIAPRPLLMVSATGDWTKNTLEQEYPAVRSIYTLFNAPDQVSAVRFDAPHNYAQEAREAMYAFMARSLQGAPKEVKRPEKSFTPDPLADVLVFHGRALPEHAVTAAQLTDTWIASSKRQLEAASPDARRRALEHALGGGQISILPPVPSRPVEGSRSDPYRAVGTAGISRTVFVAGIDADLERSLKIARLDVRPIAFTPFDAEAASKIRHFETYNRTQAGQRVADIAAALRQQPDAVLVAQGDAALAGLLAVAVAPARLAILDVESFDSSSDAAFLQRLYIPGLRRAGDLQTAAANAHADVIVHNAGARFAVNGPKVLRQKLTAKEMLALIIGTPQGGGKPAPAGQKPTGDPNTKDWIQIFNGRNLDGWTPKFSHYELGHNLNGTFRVEDGMLEVRYDKWETFKDEFGHLFYKDPFSYYIIAAEYRFVGEQVKTARTDLGWALRNNGLMLHSPDPRTMTRDQDFPISMEVQLLGGLSNGRPRTTANLCTPGTHVVLNGKLHTAHCTNSTSKTYDGDQWVRVEVVVHGDELIRHLVEGQTVLEYSKPQIGGGNASPTDPAVKIDGTPLTGGFISIQAETAPIDFRKIEVLNLEGCTDPKAKNYKTYYVKANAAACRY
jgi:3-keto-disaccharide hydrolase